MVAWFVSGGRQMGVVLPAPPSARLKLIIIHFALILLAIFYLSLMKKFRLPLLLLVLSAGCSSEIDPTYISQRNWVYESGFKAGDLNVIDFKSGLFELSHDTIFMNGEAQAITTGLHKGDNILDIKSMTGVEGKYLDMVEYSR